MATNPTTDIKNAGFFGGATELAQYLVETGAAHERSNMEIESKQKIMEIDGQKYCWDSRNLCWVPIKPVKFIPDDEIVPPALTFFTLDGLIDYIKENDTKDY